MRTYIKTIITCIALLGLAGNWQVSAAANNIDSGNQDGIYEGELRLESGTETKYGKWFYDKVHIAQDATLFVQTYNGNTFSATGTLELYANEIVLEGKIDGVGRAYRGFDGASGAPGGGGGTRGRAGHWDGNSGGSGGAATQGRRGEGLYGGEGGWGYSGNNGSGGRSSTWASGGSGGRGGHGIGRSGQNGGYVGIADNTEKRNNDLTVYRGSAGGAGGGGAGGGGGGGGGIGAGYKVGGHGGRGGSGGRGGKGGNGGSLVKLFATKKLIMHGIIDVSGQSGSQGSGGYGGAGGHKEAGWKDYWGWHSYGGGKGGSGGRGGRGSDGGHGAGGGVLLFCPQVQEEWFNGFIYSKGGGWTTSTSAKNGGTVKIFSPGSEIPSVLIQAGKYFHIPEIPKPDQPEIIKPKSGEYYPSRAVKFSVKLPPTLTRGRIYIEISKSMDFSNIEAGSYSEVLNSKKNWAELNQGFQSYGIYYWRAWCVDSLGLSSEKTTPAKVELVYAESPQLISPHADKTLAVKVVKLTAKYHENPDSPQPGKVAYQVSSHPEFVQVKEFIGQTMVDHGLESSVSVGGLPPGRYYWRAYSVDQEGIKSDFSASRKFTLSAEYANPPQLVSPAADASLKVKVVRLTATYQENPETAPNKGSVVYQLYTDPELNHLLAEYNSTALTGNNAETAVEITDLSPGIYYWRAYSIDELDMRSSYSLTRKLILGVAPPDSMDCRVRKNLINRNNSTCDIYLDISQSGTVNVSLYNLVGERIKTIVKDQVLAPGFYTYTWNGTNELSHEVSSGIYILEIRAKDFVQRNKIAVVK
ncbi:hypothetical protein KAR34_02790 [bacterium]|nr:hypothetical protein [bacterium]